MTSETSNVLWMAAEALALATVKGCSEGVVGRGTHAAVVSKAHETDSGTSWTLSIGEHRAMVTRWRGSEWMIESLPGHGVAWPDGTLEFVAETLRERMTTFSDFVVAARAALADRAVQS